jgi:hypothetical protein
MRRLLLGTMFVSFGLWGAGVFGPAVAAAKGKKPVTAAPVAGRKVNACGCYADTLGNCFCGRKGKCACPGECEPKGCDDKRAKEMQKAVAAETKKAADADKKQKQKSIDAEKKETKRDRQKEIEKEKGIAPSAPN